MDQFVQDMDEIVIRWDQSSIDPVIRKEAVEKAQKLEADGQQVRDDSLRGLVRKRDEVARKAKEEGKSLSPPPKKAKRNEVARKVDVIIGEMEKENKKDEEIVKKMQEIENQHHADVIASLQSLTRELKEDRLERYEEAKREKDIRRQEWLEMMRVLARGLDRT